VSGHCQAAAGQLGGVRAVPGLCRGDPATARQEKVAAAAVFVFIGAEPRTEWLRDVMELDTAHTSGRDIASQAWSCHVHRCL
jgi:thioredoxin reductase (NADPH)